MVCDCDSVMKSQLSSVAVTENRSPSAAISERRLYTCTTPLSEIKVDHYICDTSATPFKHQTTIPANTPLTALVVAPKHARDALEGTQGSKKIDPYAGEFGGREAYLADVVLQPAACALFPIDPGMALYSRSV